MRLRFAVIPAAGLGTRMLSVNSSIPKELLPVGSKPSIQFAIEEAVSIGIHEIVIVINPRKYALRSYFELSNISCNSSSKEAKNILSNCSITFVEQAKPTGVADAISLTKSVIGDEAFALIMPDIILFSKRTALQQILPVFNHYKLDTIAIVRLHRKNADMSGSHVILESRQIEKGVYKIVSLHKENKRNVPIKKLNNNLRTAGFAICGSHFFEYIERARKHTNGEFNDADVFREIRKDHSILGVALEGELFDVGNPRGYLEANNFMHIML